MDIFSCIPVSEHLEHPDTLAPWPFPYWQFAETHALCTLATALGGFLDKPDESDEGV